MGGPNTELVKEEERQVKLSDLTKEDMVRFLWGWQLESDTKGDISFTRGDWRFTIVRHEDGATVQLSATDSEGVEATTDLLGVKKVSVGEEFISFSNENGESYEIWKHKGGGTTHQVKSSTSSRYNASSTTIFPAKVS